jgi:hypothetical protein
LASCVAQDAVASQLPGSNCFDLGNSAGNCALGCLSPLNWFGLNKFGVRGPREKGKRMTSRDDPLDQLEQIEKAQQKVRKGQSP